MEVAGDSSQLSLEDITARLQGGPIERVVASISERRVAPLRVLVVAVVAIWVAYWGAFGPQSVLVDEAMHVYLLVSTVLCLCVAWWAVVRFALSGWQKTTDIVGIIINFAIVALLTKHAFVLLMTLDAILPILAIMIGVKYSRRWFNVGIFASLAVLLWSAPSGYWLSRPAYLLYAIVLTVGLPLLIARIFSALREISLQAIEAMDVQNRFVGAMSHELRTPLNVVINSLALLDRAGMAPNQSRLLDLAEASSSVLSKRVQSVLEISKSRSDRAGIRSDTIDLSSLMDGILQMHSLAARSKGVRLGFDAGSSLPVAVLADHGRIEQVLSNLTSNAIKYTPRGGAVSLRLFAMEIAGGQQVELRFEVQDSGIGIPDSEKTRIFEPFYQVPDPADGSREGVGMGLFIVRSVTEQLGARLYVTDNIGGGSLFTWCVLAAVSQAQCQTASAREILHEASQRFRAGQRSLQCLVIDDHVASAEILTRVLEKAGCSVVTAKDGLQGIGEIRRRTFDAVILDLQMPEMSGWDVLGALEGRPDLGAPPIIVLSADSDPEVSIRALKAGATAFISKPVSASALLDQLSVIAGGVRGKEAGAQGVGFPLGELRQFESSQVVARLLRQIEEGLLLAKYNTGRALIADDRQLLLQSIHHLSNEFGLIGFAEARQRAREAEQLARNGPVTSLALDALYADVDRALHWIGLQPEVTA